MQQLPASHIPPHSSDLDRRAFKPLPSGIENPYVNIPRIREELRDYPNQQVVEYIAHGIEHGFDIGFRGPFTETFPKNNSSSRILETELTETINKEVERGHTAGPFVNPPFLQNHISPLGAAVKDDGSARLIMDLSQPAGESINDFIDREEFPCSYVHFDVATALIRKMGRGCLLSKIDIRHAFRLLPVRPEDWPLLVYYWHGRYYVDLKLPFGSRSSPSIFTEFADLLCWILTTNYSLIVIHYADDYLLLTIPCLILAQKNLEILLEVFDFLGVPVAKNKLIGPTTEAVYLGIQINTDTFEMSIPQKKRDEVLSILPKWIDRRTCKKRNLLSLIGKLQHCAKVVRAGRIFVRRLITLSTLVSELHHHVTLNNDAKADIQWWCEFLPKWNFASIIPESLIVESTDLSLFTDAAKTVGFGAVMGNSWIQARWPPHMIDDNIDIKELFAIMAATLTWGAHWTGKRIVFITDNKPITQIWAAGSTPSPILMKLVRRIFLFAAQNDFSVSFKHIFGHFNAAADALSRFQDRRFRELVPQAEHQATPIPPAIWDVLT